MREALYHELAEYYDLINAEKDYPGEARRLIRIARRHLRRPVRSLLDVACGTGRHLEAFRREFEVAGVDASPAMLAIARRRLGRTVPLVRGDMRTFRLDRQFDVLVCLFSAFGYLRTRGDRERALANFFRHVAPEGLALVEGWVRPERWREKGLHLQTYDGPEVKIARLSRSRRRGRVSIVNMEYLIGEAGRPLRHRSEEHRLPLVGAKEMLESFRAVGFRSSALLSGPYRDRGLYLGYRPPDPPRVR